MKIERLNSSRKKKAITFAIVALAIIVTLVLITSKAKYKNIETLDLVNGTINYTPADIDLVAIQIENDNGEYEVTDTIPSSGYILSDTSYCNVNGEKDTSIKLTYANGLIGISDITKKVKSNRKSALEFKRKTLNELINKGFSKLDINEILDTFMISDDDLELEHLINKLYKKYSLKYDNKTTILKIKNYLYQKGYQSFLVEEHLKKLPS